MNFKKDLSQSNCIQLDDNIFLHVINILELTPTLKQDLDRLLIEISTKGHDNDLNIVKKKLKIFFNSKKESNLEIGAIAEFITHLYLNLNSFNQECLFINLEENSIKKGFDGVYSKSGELWLVESKSGRATSKEICHGSKITEAYNDLRKKVMGEVKNNPWQNAYMHAALSQTDENLLKEIKNLEISYLNKKYTQISEHNIIPSSTIFYDLSSYEEINIDQLKEKIKVFLRGKAFRKINVICVNKKTKKILLDYLDI